MRPADIASTLLAFALFVFAFALAGTAFARSADAPPSTPGNFRAALHDDAGGERAYPTVAIAKASARASSSSEA